MRVTVLVRNTAGIKAAIRSRTARQRQRVLEATQQGAEQVTEQARALCPVDTGFMVDRLRTEIGGDGDRFAVGFRAEDFVGQVNPATGKEITAFYPVFVVFGTRFMAGNDFLTAALRAEQATIRQGYTRALNGR